MVNFVGFLTLSATIVQFYNFHRLGRDEVPRWSLLYVYVCYAVVEGWLAYRDPMQGMIGLFVLVDLWAIWQLLRPNNKG